MRLINYNYTQLRETIVTASSQDVNFPAQNIKSQFRNKVWRSSRNGFFHIGTHNKIDFKESEFGAELTVTVTQGVYTADSLSEEIQAQLNFTGTNSYSVSFNHVTGKWTVVSDGTFFSLLNESGTNASSSIMTAHLGFANTDRSGGLSYTGPRIAIHTEEFLTFDNITTEEIDSVVLLWPKGDGIKLSGSASLKIQANATNNWDSPAINQSLSINNDYEVASHFFSVPQSFRFWRLLIEDAENANLYVEMGVVVLGKSLSISNPDIGIEYEVQDQSKITSNMFGNRFTDEYPNQAVLSVKYGLLDYEEAKIFENCYRLNGNRLPVLAVVDPEDSVFSKDHFLIYGTMSKPSRLSQLHYKYFSSDLVIEECS